MKNELVELELALGKKKSPVCLDALKSVLAETVGAYKDFSLYCNFQELVAACIFYLEICVTHTPNIALSKEIILSAASELEKSCRHCLNRILFKDGTYDLETESAETGIRLSVLQIASMIRELGLKKEDMLLEKGQAEIDHTLQSLKPQLTIAFNRIIEDSITSLSFIDKRVPELSLLVTSQGLVGYLIGVVARLTKKEMKHLDDLPNMT